MEKKEYRVLCARSCEIGEPLRWVVMFADTAQEAVDLVLLDYPDVSIFGVFVSCSDWRSPA